jgi:hypothetical protein
MAGAMVRGKRLFLLSTYEIWKELVFLLQIFTFYDFLYLKERKARVKSEKKISVCQAALPALPWVFGRNLRCS